MAYQNTNLLVKKKQAIAARDYLIKAIDNYGQATIGDLYFFSNRRTMPEDELLGWNDRRAVEESNVRKHYPDNKFYLDLPEPTRLRYKM